MNTLLAFGLPSGGEWIIVLLIVVLLFGAKKLPELFRGLGRSIGEFKRGKEEIERDLHGDNSTVVDTSRPQDPTKKA